MYRHCFKSDCSNPIKTRGLCNMHYLQLWKEEQSHRDDNRLENLQLWVGAPVRGIRRDDAIVWAKEILERYT